MTAGLVAFLRARLDEDEAVARATMWDRSGNTPHWDEPASAVIHTGGGNTFMTGDREVNRHIAHHDPERVLRAVAAQQAILEAFRIADVSGQVLPDDRNIGEADGLEEALRHLAAVYDDHPDYQAGWRP